MNINAAQSIQNITGAPVKISCILSFALNTSSGFTGSDCRVQSDLPSSEIEGAAISFIEAAAHTAVNSSITALPEFLPKSSFITSISVLPFIIRATPKTGSSKIPSPQFSI